MSQKLSSVVIGDKKTELNVEWILALYSAGGQKDNSKRNGNNM